MLAYSEIQIGTTVYIIQDFPENNQRDWRILTDTLFKGDEYLWNLRIELDTFLSNQKK